MKISILAITLLFSAVSAPAANLQTFLKHCAYGTLIGAGMGVVSLALSDKPGDNTGNIAKGASLGLYGGIGYGIHKLNEVPPPVNTVVDPYAAIIPSFEKGRLDGAQFVVNLANF